MERIVLINGRFELLNSPDRIDVFDLKNLKRDQLGRVTTVTVITLDVPVTDYEAGKRALLWMRDSKYIDQTEFFEFLEIFLANRPVDQAAADKQTYDNGRGRVSPMREH